MPWTVADQELRQQGAFRCDGIATDVVIDDGGTLKIANHRWARVTRFED